ncbi:hypothetical protein J7363_04630 [Phaeobacter italicus]|uniref:hypothetical protein n=1 Tax=Phaeobacter italicus TaxID=481446 RepID=UPI001ADAB5C7|nr:hypothetical protein [Phaeobacter italicus]MBO9441366.1 hypothetical protein [Phaeobacter italicus]
MRDLLFSMEFWLAMAAAILLKLRASPQITLFGAITTTASAICCALVFTEPLMDWLELDGEVYTYAVCALIALTGEHIARQILSLGIEDAVRLLRGNKK